MSWPAATIRARSREVGVRPLGILLPEGAPEEPLDTEKPRLKLANWITDPSNPLTARVMVNRVWQYHFGRGIVYHRRTISAAWARRRRIPRCWTVWRTSSSRTAGR